MVALGVLVPVYLPAQAFSLAIFAGRDGAGADPAAASSSQQAMTLPLPAANIDPNPAQGGGDITVVDGAALEAQAGPSGTAADIEEWPTSSQISVYTVHAGDTLSGIAQMFGVSVNTIVWANDISNDVIQPGETLIILPITGVRHTVAGGETLASIAKAFDSNAEDIAQYNGLDASAPLAAGTSIIIPDGEIEAAPPVQNTAQISSASNGGASAAGSSSQAPSSSSSSSVPAEPYLGGSGPAIPGYYAWPTVASAVVTQDLHGWNAVDIAAPTGTHIYAAATGIVIVAKDDGAWNGGYGNYVVIQHPNNTQTLYAHMSKVLVSPGQPVTQGQTIGLIGATGEATGPHVHFEVRGAKNPFAYLPLGSSEPQ